MTTHQDPPRIVLNGDEFAAYALHNGWTSVRKQAKALGLDHVAVGDTAAQRSAVGAKFMARLLAHATRDGEHTLGEAFERFFDVTADDSELSAAA